MTVARPGRDSARSAAWLLGFAPVVYLALRGGGYDDVIRGEVGIAVWWLILIGLFAGMLPQVRIARSGSIALSFLALFCAWTTLAAWWSIAPDLTVTEAGRDATYLGFLMLALLCLRGETVRSALNGITTALGLVAVVALASALAPSAFPVPHVTDLFSGSRLSYPLNYADGNGEFLALGLPLLLNTSAQARTAAARALSAASLPLVVLAIALTASRGAALTAVVAVAALLILTDNRTRTLAIAGIASAGGVVLLELLHRRPAFDRGLVTSLAVHERHQMAALAVVTFALVAGARLGLDLLLQRPFAGPDLTLSYRSRVIAVSAVGAAFVAIAIVAGLPSALSHGWHDFQQVEPAQTPTISGRVLTLSGSHRYQYWDTALHAFASRPLGGIGPGTFQLYWAQHGSLAEFVLYPHSLYVEALAETGLVGLGLIAALLATTLLEGTRRAIRGSAPLRGTMAAATSALAGFCVAAGSDWVWQIPALPIVALLLAGVVLSSALSDRLSGALWEGSQASGRAPVRTRALFGGLGLLALLVVTIPFAETVALRRSQADDRAGHYSEAVAAAATAAAIEPYAPAPELQRALELAQVGDVGAAGSAAARATAAEPAAWQAWLIRSRIATDAGEAALAESFFADAHQRAPIYVPSSSVVPAPATGRASAVLGRRLHRLELLEAAALDVRPALERARKLRRLRSRIRQLRALQRGAPWLALQPTICVPPGVSGLVQSYETIPGPSCNLAIAAGRNGLAATLAGDDGPDARSSRGARSVAHRPGDGFVGGVVAAISSDSVAGGGGALLLVVMAVIAVLGAACRLRSMTPDRRRVE